MSSCLITQALCILSAFELKNLIKKKKCVQPEHQHPSASVNPSLSYASEQTMILPPVLKVLDILTKPFRRFLLL